MENIEDKIKEITKGNISSKVRIYLQSLRGTIVKKGKLSDSQEESINKTYALYLTHRKNNKKKIFHL
jgi:hypothetical protein